ncbi:MAG: glucuronate isomerase, partial [Clostridia bacterium]|nr:glucuronate isomerase [Clostridia bacterium]
VPENEITGEADDYTKFLRFAEVLPKLIGNPMYHWCHLELKRYFGYDGVLNKDTAKEVYELCNKKLQQEDMTVRSIIKKSNVKMIGTTDDPIDSLEWHQKLKADKSFDVLVAPSFRPDKAINIDKEGFAEYIEKLGTAAEMKITSVQDIKAALKKRLDFFCALGCRATDHGLDYIPFELADPAVVEDIFQSAMAGKPISRQQADSYKTDILLFLGREYAKRNIVMQLHYGAQRNTNVKMFRKLGPDTGFDCISTNNCGEQLVGFMNALEEENALPKTVLYSLNPQDNELLGTILGCFQGTEVAGKIQHGSAWWFNDTKTGMEAQLKSLANLSALGNFIGMLTDSRSFLSYTRHEYFRRILCNLIGEWVENGEYPDDEKQLGQLVQDICYNNAERYFGL